MKIKCLIVDDEPLAQRILEKYIASLDYLELVEKCNHALEASSYLHQHHVDVMFLDVKMPEMTGLEFLKTLNHPPQVILTTAYSEYALEGYEYSVLDYLLKPISFERFLKAVNKIKMTKKEAGEALRSKKPEKDFIFLKADQEHHKIKYQDIKYLQGYGNYVKVFFADRKILVSDTLTHMESLLPWQLFIRIHKSYIIAIKKIEKISENSLTISDTTIPIGRTYKNQVKEIIKKYTFSDKEN